MRNAVPVISEDADTLKQHIQRANNGRKKSRLQMLYLLASGQAQTRQEVAQLLGIHRNTLGHWLAIYAVGGLDALLDVYVPPGQSVALPPDVLAGLLDATIKTYLNLAVYEEDLEADPPSRRRLTKALPPVGGAA